MRNGIPYRGDGDACGVPSPDAESPGIFSPSGENIGAMPDTLTGELNLG